jgi:hypothetical protein
MNCQACGRPLAKHSETQVSCKAGHVWVHPDHADEPLLVLDATRSEPFRPSDAPRQIPAWLPGTVLGVLALIGEVILWLH